MRIPLRLRFSTGHTLVVAVLAPLGVVLFWPTRYWWAGIALATLGAIAAFVTFYGRRLTGWVATVFVWFRRRRKPMDIPSEPVVGATVKPGDHVAVRWRREQLIAVIELKPRPFTPVVVVGGQAHTDDVLDTRLLEELMSVHCPDLEADVVSAGFRVDRTATPDVVDLYQQMIGADPAPANRRTWIMLRADPERAHKSAQRRGTGMAGLAQYLVASATRLADSLASNGVDAVCGRSFDDYDHATDIGLVREKWSVMLGPNAYTAAYTAPGGPDLWWSACADHTITRVRIASGLPPRTTVLLTTASKPKTPRGFSRLFGGQRLALQGQNLVANRQCLLPLGSAGLLIGETVNQCPVYMPFDDVDASITLGDAEAFTQFTLRAAAAGATVTVGPQFEQFAQLIGAQVGPVAKVVWSSATTYIGAHPGVDRVVLRPNLISTPRHRGLPIRRISRSEEKRYGLALPQ